MYGLGRISLMLLKMAWSITCFGLQYHWVRNRSSRKWVLAEPDMNGYILWILPSWNLYQRWELVDRIVPIPRDECMYLIYIVGWVPADLACPYFISENKKHLIGCVEKILRDSASKGSESWRTASWISDLCGGCASRCSERIATTEWRQTDCWHRSIRGSDILSCLQSMVQPR